MGNECLQHCLSQQRYILLKDNKLKGEGVVQSMEAQILFLEEMRGNCVGKFYPHNHCNG
jgi:hypothetical protein